MSEPKPCPFCGGEAEVFTPSICLGDNDADVDWLKICCRKCGVSHGFARFRNHDRRSQDFQAARDTAIAAWNTRAAEEGKAELVEAAFAMAQYLRETPHHNATQAAALRAALARVRGEV